MAKYGEAQIRTEGGKRYPIDLTVRNIQCGLCGWITDAPMELTYTNFARDPRAQRPLDMQTRLTYVNRPLFEDLQRCAMEAARSADRERAGRIGSLF